MAYKTVIRLDFKCSKCKKVALHSVTKIEGIESVTINIHESTLSVIGDADPVCMIQLLKKKFCCVHLVCYGPWPPPQPDTAKPDKSSSKPDTDDKSSSKLDTDESSKPNKPDKPDPPPPESSTSTSTSTSTLILYNSPCNCRPLPTSPCNCRPLPTSPCNCRPLPTFPCTPPNSCPPACKPPKCCPPRLSCSCRLEKCCPTSCPCPNKSEIMWPQYHNPLAPEDVWYVWKEDQQESCTIM